MNSKIVNIEVSRRKLMKFGAGFLGTATLASVIGLDASNPEPVVAQNDITPDQALEKLMAGNKRFLESKPTNNNQSLARLQSISEEQKPFAAILGCADSRSSLEVVFDQGFGDLFIVREAGNISTAEELGSLEFGTLVLGAKVLMVMGHYSCGAVKAAMAGDEVPGSIGSILAEIQPAIGDFQGQQEDKEAVKKATEANVNYQISKLKESPVLSELVTANKLKIVGGYFNFQTGEVTMVA
jgi:carbonic anhydrase